MQLSYLNLLPGEHISAKGWGFRVSSLHFLRDTLKPGLCCSSPTPQLRAEGSAAAGSPFAEGAWEAGTSAVGSASQGLSKAGP